MSRLEPFARTALPGPAWPWWAAVAALLAATGLAQGLTPHWQAQAEQDALLQQQLDRAAVASRMTLAAAAPPSDAERLANALPAADQAPRRLAELLALAQARGLTVHGIRQTWGSPGTGDAGGLRQLQVTLLLQGPYDALRALVAKALQHDTALALDSLHLEAAAAIDSPAEGGAVAGLRAEMQWSLLMRAPGGTAP